MNNNLQDIPFNENLSQTTKKRESFDKFIDGFMINTDTYNHIKNFEKN